MIHRLLPMFVLLLFFPVAVLAEGGGQPVNTEFSYSLEGVKNFNGGLRKGNATLGSGVLDITFDTEANGWWPGGTLFIEGLLDHGPDPSTFIGDTQTASNIADSNRTRLQQFWYEQALGNQASILFGLHDLNSEFDVSEYASLFLNSSFGIGPDITANAPAVSIFPQAGWAVRLDVHASDRVLLRAAIYDGDPSTRAVTSTEGYMKIVEVVWGAGEQAYKLGGWQHSGNKTGPDGRSFGSDSGVYAVVDQPLTVWNGGGLGMFVQLGISQKDRNDIGNYLGVGLHVIGPVVGRGDDELGIALARAGFSDLYRRVNSSSRAETTVEFTYHAQIFSWLALHPALQWIQHPGGNPTLAPAKVGMLRASVTLP